MIDSIVAAIPVRDHAAATKWYAGWIGREPDVVPDDGLAEWKLCENGWIQLFADEKRAGATVAIVGVTDLDDQRTALRTAGIDVGEVQDFPGVVRTFDVNDPDGNQISFVQEYQE